MLQDDVRNCEFWNIFSGNGMNMLLFIFFARKKMKIHIWQRFSGQATIFCSCHASLGFDCYWSTFCFACTSIGSRLFDWHTQRFDLPHHFNETPRFITWRHTFEFVPGSNPGDSAFSNAYIFFSFSLLFHILCFTCFFIIFSHLRKFISI